MESNRFWAFFANEPYQEKDLSAPAGVRCFHANLEIAEDWDSEVLVLFTTRPVRTNEELLFFYGGKRKRDFFVLPPTDEFSRYDYIVLEKQIFRVQRHNRHMTAVCSSRKLEITPKVRRVAEKAGFGLQGCESARFPPKQSNSENRFLGFSEARKAVRKISFLENQVPRSTPGDGRITSSAQYLRWGKVKKEERIQLKMPSNPQVQYSSADGWQSWDHFLGWP